MKQRVFFSNDNTKWLCRFAQAAGAFVAILGALALAGWVAGIEGLTRILPSAVAMNPTTTLAFICLGFALWERAGNSPGLPSWRKRLPYLLAGLVAFVGAIKLMQCITGWSFHIDRLLFASRFAATGPRHAGDIAPNTAIDLALCGIAVILLDFELKDGARPAQWLAILSGLIALLALLGYSYSVLVLYRPRGTIPMALGTAINLTIFSLGLLGARPQSGLMKVITSPTTGGAVARRLLPMAILVPWILGGVLLAAEQKAYFSTESAISIFAVATIFIFTGLVWWNAKLLYRADLERARAQQSLQKASANLERSNAELQQFAYVASHDLNEPLRMITSYLQLLDERWKGKLDPQAQEFIGYVLDGAERMRALIADLLAYSRLEAKATAFDEVDCEQIFQTALQNLKVAIYENNAAIEHQPLPRVRGDPVQLLQVFQNLIGNALKFHGADPPQIRAGANRHNGEWVFFVRDNGIGIDPKNFERIFVIFQRLHTRQQYSGTGMGLAICKRIVERHGGRIWVESRPQRGATFFFTLPLIRE